MKGKIARTSRSRPKKTARIPVSAELRRRAEAAMPKKSRLSWAGDSGVGSNTDSRRLVHELHVHQIELEMQNTELQEARDRAETLLARYADLYDFAPVGFFTLDEKKRVTESNLTGSDLIGVERSRLPGRFFPRFVTLACRADFLGFLSKVFAGNGKYVCETQLIREDGTFFWASLQGVRHQRPGTSHFECRLAISDITLLRQIREAQYQMEFLARSNEALKKEIVRRQEVEQALRTSEMHQKNLLAHASRLQEQLRNLTHSNLRAREDERKLISRELHDNVAQTLVGINFRLGVLAKINALNPDVLKKEIAGAQTLIENSVRMVHQVAVEMRPTSLDDLGLIIALKTYIREFVSRTGIHVEFGSFPGVVRLNNEGCTALYRIVQSALSNVAQHSHATMVNVNISKTGKMVRLKIADNGRPKNVKKKDDAIWNKHLGLIGMRERAEMLGGTLAIEFLPGKGTTVDVQMPYRRETAENS